MTENQGSDSQSPNATGYFVVAGVLGGLGAIGFNANMLASALAWLGFVVSVFAFLWSLLFRRATIRIRSQILLCITLLVAVLYAERRGMTWMLERKLAPLVTALEAHHSEKGSYPEQAEALVPGFRKNLPWCHYSRHETGPEGFSLTCVTFGFNKHTYNSVTKTWQDWD